MHTYLRLSENQYIHIYYKKYLYYAINKKKIVRVSLTNVSQLHKNCILNQWSTKVVFKAKYEYLKFRVNQPFDGSKYILYLLI